MYSKTWCPFCTEANSILQAGDLEFEVVELDKISNGDEIQNKVEEISGQRTVPNIFVAGNHIGGCSELKQKLERGQLQEMFEAAGIKHTF